MYARAWVRNSYAMQSARDYACLCMWLCTSTPCSQFVNLHAWACEYVHLRWADSLRLCMHVHVIMPIYAMQPVYNYVQEHELWNFMPCSHLVTMYACACDYAHLQHAVRLYFCKSLSYAHSCHAVSLRLCMHVDVTMHIYAMQSDCNFACMSMWLCMHEHVIMCTHAM